MIFLEGFSISDQLPFEDFAKIDLKIGIIVDASRLSGTKKLMKLTIDIGGETRQSVAGLGDQYNPEDLKSKLVVVVTNLKPRKIFGLESQLMLLAAVDGSQVSLVQPDRPVSLGCKVT